MNMLRVWGGGIYMSDDFYRECDEKGILVWQDFMFAGSMYPGDEKFLENVKEEVKQLAERLNTHPSLALWCGNNECDEGWNNWGWQKQYKYSPSDSLKIWQDYQKLFHELIPSVLKEISPAIGYWPSSPSIGWGKKESLNTGDSHYWGVWWGNEPLGNYATKTGRFMSEYGFQSLPALYTFKQVCDTAQLNLNSPCVKNHQKNSKGFETIRSYMEKEYKIPSGFDEYIYVSQLLQFKAMTMAIEAHRKNKPRCMGTMFWQMNDCWPSVSWSAMDYYKNNKAFAYHLRSLYSNFLLSIEDKGNRYDLIIVSDSAREASGKLKIELKDFSGKNLYSKDTLIKVKADTVQLIYSLPKMKLTGIERQAAYLSAGFSIANKTYKTLHYFVKPKDLLLKQADIKWNIDPKTNILTVSADQLIKNLFISINDGSVTLTENYFDLEAGEIRKLQLPPGTGKTSPVFYSLNSIK
jgi:beta-mannosidase